MYVLLGKLGQGTLRGGGDLQASELIETAMPDGENTDEAINAGGASYVVCKKGRAIGGKTKVSACHIHQKEIENYFILGDS